MAYEPEWAWVSGKKAERNPIHALNYHWTRKKETKQNKTKQMEWIHWAAHTHIQTQKEEPKPNQNKNIANHAHKIEKWRGVLEKKVRLFFLISQCVVY